MLIIAVSMIEPREAEADWSIFRILESASKQTHPTPLQPGIRVSINTLNSRLEQGDFPQLKTQTESKQPLSENKGPALLDWDGLPVEQWTFSDETGAVFQLYLIDLKDLNPEPSIKTPLFKELGTTALAAWTASGTLYVLAHEGTIDTLRPILKNVGVDPKN